MTDSAQEIAQRVTHWIRPDIRSLRGYHVPSAEGMIKLDAMENPYPLPETLLASWLEMLQSVALNRYPDANGTVLKERIRQTMAIPDDVEMLLGNGSDELIQLLILAVHRPGQCILAAEPSFSMYRMIARYVGINYVGVPLRGDDFSLDLAAMYKAICLHRPAVVFLAYPNNPTGNLYPRDQLHMIVQGSPGIVVVDEAYCSFAREAFLSRLSDYPNLLILRTLSKMGLAGVRLGMLFGAGAWLEQLDKIRLPYNINVLSQVTAEFALRHYDVFRAQAEQIKRDRDAVLSELAGMSGVVVYPSEANFFLLKILNDRVAQVYEGLLSRNILVKNLHGSHPLLKGCLRITVGTPEENAALLAGLREILDG